MNLATLLAGRIDGALEAIASLRGQMEALEATAQQVLRTLGRGGRVYTAGNGGSAAQAMHLAEELIGRYRANRLPQPAVCLNADSTALTCIANDFGFEAVFARQCEALLCADDALIVLSTSGNSANLLRALEAAQQVSATSIGLLGNDGGRCRELCDHVIIVPGRDSAHIQEAHQVIVHLMCEAVEAAIGGASFS